MDLRCDNKLFGVVVDGAVEIKCSSKYCGAGDGYIVIHRFDLVTATLTDTRRYRDPARRRTS